MHVDLSNGATIGRRGAGGISRSLSITGRIVCVAQEQGSSSAFASTLGWNYDQSRLRVMHGSVGNEDVGKVEGAGQ